MHSRQPILGSIAPAVWKLISRWQALVTSLAIIASSVPKLTADVVVTQTISLHPGWNAIWVEVDPTNNATGAVFSGVPVESVWGYQERLPASDFIQDSGEPAWNTASMLMFLPAPNVAAFQNNLYVIQPNRPYLVKLKSATNATLSITGSPYLRFDPWRRNVYNLRGLPVDPSAAPTFAAYFANSPAHKNQLIYGIDANGKWVQVNPTSRIQPGQAYWIRSLADTAYLGSLSVTLDRGTALDFGLDADSLALSFVNLSGGPGVFRVTDLSGSASPYSYNGLDPNNASYQPLPAILSLTNGASTTANLNLYPRRGDIQGGTNQTVLSISTSVGTRFFVGLSASTVGNIPVGATPQTEAAKHAGLWIGTATVDSVSEAHGGVLVTNLVLYPDGSQRPQVQRIGAGIIPTPVRPNSGFNLRLILHVDTNGVTRLLREVYRMWANGTYTNDPASSLLRVATPGRYVLITDDSVLPQFSGSTVKDGAQIGRRYTSAQFDFATPGGQNYLEMTGDFAMSTTAATNTVTATNILGKDFATNPFRHKFHPDHQQGYDITRIVSLQFGPKPDASTDPSAGYDYVTGIYGETISGLHKTNIVVQGSFSLRRIDNTGVLNQ